MKTFYVQADSTAWCGVSVCLIVNTPDHYTEEDIQDNDKIISIMDDGMFDFMGDDSRFKNDEDDEDEEVDCSWAFATIEETTDPEMINCAAYETVDLTE